MRPWPLLAHQRDDLPRQLVPAEEIGLELFAQHVGRQVLDGAGLAIGAVVEQRIDASAGARA